MRPVQAAGWGRGWGAHHLGDLRRRGAELRGHALAVATPAAGPALIALAVLGFDSSFHRNG
jgi:hypothetical protein